MTIIYWGNPSAKTSLYGSIVQYISDDKVIFENMMLPSSTVIHQWQSKVNFQKDRITPQLPLLRQGQTYYFSWDMIVEPVNSVYFTIEFYDYSQEIIQSIVLSEQDQSFICPKNMSHYDIKLSSSGCQKIEFHYLNISEQKMKMTTHYAITNIQNMDQKNTVLRVIFAEPTDSVDDIKKQVENLTNVMIVTSQLPQCHLYVRDECIELVLGNINKIKHLFDYVHFIGYGPISNVAALIYQKKYYYAFAYIVDDFLPIQYYNKILRAFKEQATLPFNSNLRQIDIHTVYYCQDKQEHLSLFSPLFKKINRLNHLVKNAQESREND